MNDARPIDLRSDTVTLPSREMMEAIALAELGDDVYGGDPTVRRLEQEMADTVGMEAGLFVTSGTQSNLTALMSHLGRAEEFIAGDQFHVFKYEGCGSAVLGSLAPHPLATPPDGCLDPAAVEAAIRPDDVHHPVTRLLCLENTFNGTAVPLEHQEVLADLAHARGLLVHLDGARLFNACTALDVTPQALCAKVDSVSVCLSKGLGAPVGSVLCGDRAFIERGRRMRKLLGGGLRQAGILAACGLVALEREVPRLQVDHDNARRLAEGLESIDALAVVPCERRTNMVFVRVAADAIDALRDHLASANIVTGSQRPVMRLVTHRDVSSDDVERVVTAFREFFRRGASTGATAASAAAMPGR